MKPNQTIPLICGCVALIVSIGFLTEFSNNVDANGFGIAIITTTIPIAALGACVWFILKGK
jgi:hypothetical protein